MTFICTRFQDTFPEACLLIFRSEMPEYWARKTNTACMAQGEVREVDFGWAVWVKLTRIETEDIPVCANGGLECIGTGRQPVHAAQARTTYKVENERWASRRERSRSANLGLRRWNPCGGVSSLRSVSWRSGWFQRRGLHSRVERC